jgi:protein TonB
MGIVAGMHVAVIFIIARSLGLVPSAEIPTTDLVTVDEPVQPDDPLPRIEPELERSTIPFIPEPESPPVAEDPQTDTITAKLVPVTEIPRQTGTGSAEVVPTIINARQDPRHPLSQPTYSPAEIRAGNSGSADVEIYVLPSGRVGEARIVRSTGFERLDRATIEEAKRNWRLVPATRDGQPIAQWYRLRVVFKLTNQ